MPWNGNMKPLGSRKGRKKKKDICGLAVFDGGG
jgi:hypothetical protein